MTIATITRIKMIRITKMPIPTITTMPIIKVLTSLSASLTFLFSLLSLSTSSIELEIFYTGWYV